MAATFSSASESLFCIKQLDLKSKIRFSLIKRVVMTVTKGRCFIHSCDMEVSGHLADPLADS